MPFSFFLPPSLSYFLSFYVFLEGRDGEREGEKRHLVASRTHPQWGRPTTQTCTLTRNQTFCFAGQCSTTFTFWTAVPLALLASTEDSPSQSCLTSACNVALIYFPLTYSFVLQISVKMAILNFHFPSHPDIGANESR